MNKEILSLFDIRLGFRVVMLVVAVTIMAAAPAAAQVSQDNEQEGESGEADQSFEVTGSGDNSNQCAGLQGTANTGNAQNVTDINQYRSRVDEIEIEDSGASIDESPENSTECEQAVNQAASAAAPKAAAPAAAAPKAAPAPAAALPLRLRPASSCRRPAAPVAR